MLKRHLPGGKSRIPYLLRHAFAEAEEGDAESAWKFWNQAISEGYLPTLKTKRRLLAVLREDNNPQPEEGAKP